ncbi:hypothetical protein B0H65DRAFT_455090 [Neurospora tetraspora]|uniref:Uncharacterized protein n=1 Tax=Neurospora tetraspora TaxID=94610 RepID=A0AAE0JIX5_9PEZI|nr:hypothetical protein B0H65DRAFT_455090 [Neurospora tetraspora]
MSYSPRARSFGLHVLLFEPVMGFNLLAREHKPALNLVRQEQLVFWSVLLSVIGGACRRCLSQRGLGGRVFSALARAEVLRPRKKAVQGPLPHPTICGLRNLRRIGRPALLGRC